MDDSYKNDYTNIVKLWRTYNCNDIYILIQDKP